MKIELLTNPLRLLTSNANLIVLGEQSSVTFKIPSTVQALYVPGKDYYSEPIENEAELLCTIDLDAIFTMYELCVDYKDLFIWDPKGLHNSWALLLGLECYRNKDVSLHDTLFNCASAYPTIKPSSLWFIEVLDLGLGLNGNLIQIVEEYLATGQLVKVGNIFHGQWFAEQFSN